MSNDVLSPDDKNLFRQEMRNVKPLDKANKNPCTRGKIPTPHATIKKIVQEPEKTPSHYYSNYVHDPVNATAILSFHQSGIPSKRFKELKQGTIRYDGRLDLHGLTLDLAGDTLFHFIEKHIQAEHRCVLIIHGKGGKHGEAPILKNRVNLWLRQISDVLAFHSALPKDGGSGAVYVLLKRLRM